MASMGSLTVAACTVVAREVDGFEQFADHMRSVLDRASGADLVVLPELVTLELAGAGRGAAGGAAGNRPAGLTDAYRDLFRTEAARREQCIVAGSHLVVEGGRRLNVSHTFTAGGDLHAHAKTHVVADELADGVEEGDTMTAVELPIATVGVLVCYEAEFPECSHALVHQGAEVLLCPSFTETEHGFWRVRHCLHARCVEHQVFAVHAGLAGVAPALPNGGFARSSVIGPSDSSWAPNGVIAETEANVEQVAIAELDLESLHRSRRDCPAPTHRDRGRKADLHETWRSHPGRR